MTPSTLYFGIPNVLLPGVDGGEINPADFVGHELVVFFCPADNRGASTEIDSYLKRASEFEACGAWLLGIVRGQAEALVHSLGSAQITLLRDSEGEAWMRFENLLPAQERNAETDGATFLFRRGGSLSQAWPGGGHAGDALAALRA